MSEERVDLSAVELAGAERERVVAAIMRGAQAELSRRAAEDMSPLLLLTGWARPALAAAAVLALVCLSVLVRPAGVPEEIGTGIAGELGVPQPAEAWLVGERAPTVADVFAVMEREAN